MSGKRHWVVRLGPGRGRWVYAFIALAAYGLLGLEVVMDGLPASALVALLPAVLSAPAAYQLLRYSAQPHRLIPAIRLTLLAALSQGLLLAGALWWSAL